MMVSSITQTFGVWFLRVTHSCIFILMLTPIPKSVGLMFPNLVCFNIFLDDPFVLFCFLAYPQILQHCMINTPKVSLS